MITDKIKLFIYNNSSIGYARQRGIEHSLGEYIAFIDSDCILPSSHWLTEMISGFEDSTIAGTWVLGKCDRSCSSIMRYSILSHPLRNHEPLIVNLENYIPIGTGHTIIRKKIIEQVGGFKDLQSAEDIEITYLIVKLGYKFKYMYGNEVLHYHVASFLN